MNITNNFTTGNFINEIPAECMTRKDAYSLDCLYKTICPQFNKYLIKTGLIIIITYIILSWLLWWFFKYGYKLTQYREIKFIGNLHHINTRIYWDTWIRARISKAMLGYISIIVYLSIKSYK
jgi:hypothetical protein